MPATRNSFEMFSITGGLGGDPKKLVPSSFTGLGALEVQHLERWIRKDPSLVGEDLFVVTNQFAHFSGSKDRLDLLALDRQGNLVVIEIKRDTSGAYQDLQALRYAAFASTFQVGQIVGAYVEYSKRSDGRALSDEAARQEIEAFVTEGDIDTIDEQEVPRIILVAGAFQAGVTTTVLWLRRTTALDISCVQLVPYEVEGELLLGSSVLIPLPDAKDYEIKVAAKQQAATLNHATRLNHDAAKAFIASIPEGRWAAYGDVARAGGSPKGAMGVGAWLASPKTTDVPNIYRVLNAKGEVSLGWTATANHLPPDPAGVRDLLGKEGVVFNQGHEASAAQRWTFNDFMDSLDG